MSVLGEGVGSEEVELMGLLYGEGINYHVPLRALVSLNGVDAYACLLYTSPSPRD